MSRVITAEDVRKRLSLNDDPGINSAIESSLDGALARVRSLLMTELTRGTASDVFFVDPGAVVPAQSLYTLRLSNGFVKAPVSVYVGYSLAGVMTSTLQLNDHVLRAEKGHLRVPAGYEGTYLRVEYTYGFLPSDTPPGWLKEVVMALTTIVLGSQQISDGKSELAELIPALERHWTSIMDVKTRYSALALSPLN